MLCNYLSIKERERERSFECSELFELDNIIRDNLFLLSQFIDAVHNDIAYIQYMCTVSQKSHNNMIIMIIIVI